MISLKITNIETFLVADKYLLIRVDTDEGISGVGEAAFWRYRKSSVASLETIMNYLIGKNPLQIEQHWQNIYGNNHFRGPSVGAALSAVDIALWDIAGKWFEAPVYQLLGGKIRNKVRLYTHLTGETPEELAEDASKAVKCGFTAVRFTPLPPGYENLSHSELMSGIVNIVKTVKESVGEKIDICIDMLGRLSPNAATVLGREMEKYRLLFLEDPIVQDSAEAVARVARDTTTPIATGERYHTMLQFKDLVSCGGADIIRPDLCLAGGLSQCKKIAALAEAYQVDVVPHNWLGPVGTAACVQLAACIPNLLIQEYAGEDKPPKSEIVKETLKLENGFLNISDRPGIGVELNEKALSKYPCTIPEFG